MAKIIKPMTYWIREPFDTAKVWIGDTKDFHIHSHIYVLAYRAVALADLRFSDDAKQDLPDIDRLVGILNDDARTGHWEAQKKKIELS